MTNGEKLKEVFPSIELYEKSHDGIQIDFNSVWWNAEYKESSSSEKPNKSEIPTGSDYCISRADALRVAKNEYLRGWHNALCKALSEKYSIHCEEGNFSVIQEETITGLGLSMNCAVGKDVESYMSTIPSVTLQEPILDKIRAEIQKLRNCSCSCSDGIIDDVEDILDKYKAEVEPQESEKV